MTAKEDKGEKNENELEDYIFTNKEVKDLYGGISIKIYNLKIE